MGKIQVLYKGHLIDNSTPQVLFDGACTLCKRSIRFIIRHDKRRSLNLISRQSEKGIELLRELSAEARNADSLLLIMNQSVLTKSSAAIEIAGLMGWPWKAFLILRYIPAFVRDGLYSFVARNRYKWSSKIDDCRIE